MNKEHRKHFDEMAEKAIVGDQKAEEFLRTFLVRLSVNAPIKAVIRALKDLNDSYLDEMIEWGQAQEPKR